MSRFTREDMSTLLRDGLNALTGLGRKSRKRWGARGVKFAVLTVDEADPTQFYFEINGETFRVEVHKPLRVPTERTRS